MQLTSPISTFLLLCLPFALPFARAQAAAAATAAVAVGVAAGGGVETSAAATQYPTETTAGSLFTSNGVTSATWTLFIQTFATTALGSWDLGPSPQAGSIGLGSIAGTVGAVKTNAKRALETPPPL
ncbi:hypothetical protein LARI1_G003240 [Lachnellula arida]|uniref:Uncharacterized protein n=1 Tax=Lachnellula arida TaxID=1316785 RepID=A0A8T9BGV9_9HELO|nr:hypothetical protein LARI1_G003240 [Lachnellula arida]